MYTIACSSLFLLENWPFSPYQINKLKVFICSISILYEEEMKGINSQMNDEYIGRNTIEKQSIKYESYSNSSICSN